MPGHFNENFKDFLRAFNNAEVDYILVGGMAAILHGYVRSTGDMDLWVRKTKENYEKITKAFAEFGMPLFDMSLESFLDDKHEVWSFGRNLY